jgi:HK97 gp10 family phage protein
MIKGSIKISGLKTLKKNAAKLTKELSGAAAEKALVAASDVIGAQAKSNAPYDSSIDDGVHIRDNIRTVVEPNPDVYGMAAITYLKPFDINVFYWWFNEFGTIHIAPARFMTSAFDTKKRAALSKFAKIYKAEIALAARTMELK